MKFFDLVALIWSNLARRKGRVALTAIGVIIGTTAVVLLVSLGVGLQKNAESQLGGIGDLTRIIVYPGVSVESGGAVAVEVVGPGGMPEPAAPLTPPGSGVPSVLPEPALPPPTMRVTLRALVCPSLLTSIVRVKGRPGWSVSGSVV